MSNLCEKTVERYSRYVMPTYAPKLLFVRGRGSRLWDADGNEYLDFATGIAVCSLGHCHPGVTAAIQKQAAELVHVSNLYMNPVMPELAEKIISNCFDGTVFFCNSGAEANEAMIKLARKFGNETGRNTVVAMDNSFHGRTLATLAATGRAKYRKGFEPDTPGFKFAEFNNLESLKAAVTPDVCAVIMEPVQGEGGILPSDPEFINGARKLCDEKNVLLLFDEVQCGCGRIGTRFAWQSFGVEPDAFSMAKAIANGMPMGAMVAQRKYSGILKTGMHASTFGGTALVSAAALAVQKAFDEEGVLENCREVGEYLRGELRRIGKKYSFVKQVRGMGLMNGVVLDREAATLAGLCLKQNLVVLTAGENVLRLLPPINLNKADADEGVRKIDTAMAELAEMLKGDALK